MTGRRLLSRFVAALTLAGGVLPCLSGASAAAAEPLLAYPTLATISVRGTPGGVGLDPTAHRAYLSDQQDDTVSVIDTVTDTVLAVIAVPGSPLGVAVDPASHTVWVADSTANRVTVIDEVTDTVVNNLVVTGGPQDLVADPAHHRMLVADFGSAAVTVVDTVTRTVTVTIALPHNSSPLTIDVDPLTQVAYTANLATDSVSAVDLVAQTVATIPLHAGCLGVAVDPATDTVYATDESNVVTWIDGASNLVESALSLYGQTSLDMGEIGIDAAGGIGYVGIGDGGTRLAVIDLRTRQLITSVPMPLVVKPTAGTDGRVYAVTANGLLVLGRVTVPDAPTVTSVAPADHRATVGFAAPSATGGSAITGYTVRATDLTSPGAGGQSATGTASPLTVAGLSDGDAYSFTVSASNLAGEGPASGASAEVTPLPSPPLAGQLSSTGVGAATQSVAVAVPAAGSVDLLDSAGRPTTALAEPGAGGYWIAAGPAASGTVTVGFAPTTGFSGTAPAAQLRVTDGYGQAAGLTYTATVSKPAAPTAPLRPLTSIGPPGSVQHQQVLVPAGDSVALLGPHGPTTTLAAAQHDGTFEVDLVTGLLSFRPLKGFAGPVPAVGYSITDAYGQSATGRYQPTVSGPASPDPRIRVPRTLVLAKGARTVSVRLTTSTGHLGSWRLKMTARVGNSVVVIATGSGASPSGHSLTSVVDTLTLTRAGAAALTKAGRLSIVVEAAVRAPGHGTIWRLATATTSMAPQPGRRPRTVRVSTRCSG